MEQQTLWSMVYDTLAKTGGIEVAVVILLVAFSLVSWTIIFWKVCALYEARRNSRKFLSVFNGADNFGSVAAGGNAAGASPLQSIFRAGLGAMESAPRGSTAKPYAAPDPRQIQLNPGHAPEEMMVVRMEHAAKDEYQRLYFGLGFLATVGSTAPFIGLFGTVWGIMKTFQDLSGATSATLKAVGPSLGGALIATAAGLAVAIPAVMAYNWLLSQINAVQDQSDSFIEHFVMLVRASGYFGDNEKTAPSARELSTHAALPPVHGQPPTPAPQPVNVAAIAQRRNTAPTPGGPAA